MLGPSRLSVDGAVAASGFTVADRIAALRASIARVIFGKADVIDLVLASLLARRGFPRAMSETVSEHRHRVEAARHVPEVGAMVALVEAAAYGGRHAGEADVREARRHLATLRFRLKQRSDAVG